MALLSIFLFSLNCFLDCDDPLQLCFFVRQREDGAPKGDGYKIPPKDTDGYKIPPKEQSRRSESPPEVDHVLPPTVVAVTPAAEPGCGEPKPSAPSKSNSNSAASASSANNDGDLEEGEMRDDDVSSAVDHHASRRPILEDRDDRWRDYNHR